jgi:hypothetical protein
MTTTRAKLRLPDDEKNGNIETGSDRDASTLSFDVSRCCSCSIDGREGGVVGLLTCESREKSRGVSLEGGCRAAASKETALMQRN